MFCGDPNGWLSGVLVRDNRVDSPLCVPVGSRYRGGDEKRNPQNPMHKRVTCLSRYRLVQQERTFPATAAFQIPTSTTIALARVDIP